MGMAWLAAASAFSKASSASVTQCVPCFWNPNRLRRPHDSDRAGSPGHVLCLGLEVVVRTKGRASIGRRRCWPCAPTRVIRGKLGRGARRRPARSR